MDNNYYKKLASELLMAIMDDFRGFIVDGDRRVEVPEGKYHPQVAMEEMSKVPGWHYESGVGQNPLVELMMEKNAIYITKIADAKNPKELHRIIGYIPENFSDKIEYHGKIISADKMIKSIALAGGYDVEEYKLLDPKESNVKTPVDINRIKSERRSMTRRLRDMPPRRKLKEGDEAVFDKQGRHIGFKSNGKFYENRSYVRYSDAKKKNDDNER